MKKRTCFLLLMLFSVVLNMEAQELKPKDLLSFEKIEMAVTLSKSQKEHIKKALLSRQDSITKTDDIELRNAINNSYIKELYQVLTDAQSKKIIEAQIDLQDMQNQVAAFYNQKIEPKEFPAYHKDRFKAVLKKYQYDISFANIKNKYNKALRIHERSIIIKKRSIWFSEHVNALNESNKLWRIANRQYTNLQESLKDDFVSYHLYTYFKKNQAIIAAEINKEQDQLVKGEGFKELIALMVNYKSAEVLTRLKVHIKDSIIHNNVKKELDSIYLKALETKVTLSENLVEPHLVIGPINIPEFIKTKLVEIKQVKSVNALEVLEEKARKAGLEDARVNQFLALVNKKEADIAAYKAAKKENTTSSILEVGDIKKVSEIKKDFLKDLTSLINKKEFAEILGDDLKPIAIKKAKEEMKAVLASYKLTEEQRKAVYKKMAVYYLNETIANAYYKHDKRLLKQKLSGLRYYFEKEYKAMMDDFDIKISPSKKAKKNTYQY